MTPDDFDAAQDPGATRGWSRGRRGGTPGPSLVGQTLGNYRVVRMLGRGGIGEVYLGEHPLVGARVAIKVLHEEFADSAVMVERFVQEARAANAIPSAHVVRVTDFGETEDGRQYAVMEYLEGQALADALDANGPLDVPRVAEIVRQVAEAMARSHEAGVVHRDLKPENLFLQHAPVGNGEFVRILDFGIAKLFEGAWAAEREGRANPTAVGAVLGTPIYCSPEQACGKAVGPATDIYALGAVAYELLTGKTIFEGNPVEVLIHKSTRDVPPVQLLRPEVPDAMALLIQRMLARQPEDRPASMQDVALALSDLSQPQPPTRKVMPLAPTLVSRVTPPPDECPTVMRPEGERGSNTPALVAAPQLGPMNGGTPPGWATGNGTIPPPSSAAPTPLRMTPYGASPTPVPPSLSPHAGSGIPPPKRARLLSVSFGAIGLAIGLGVLLQWRGARSTAAAPDTSAAATVELEVPGTPPSTSAVPAPAAAVLSASPAGTNGAANATTSLPTASTPVSPASSASPKLDSAENTTRPERTPSKPAPPKVTVPTPSPEKPKAAPKPPQGKLVDPFQG